MRGKSRRLRNQAPAFLRAKEIASGAGGGRGQEGDFDLLGRGDFLGLVEVGLGVGEEGFAAEPHLDVHVVVVHDDVEGVGAVLALPFGLIEIAEQAVGVVRDRCRSSRRERAVSRPCGRRSAGGKPGCRRRQSAGRLRICSRRNPCGGRPAPWRRARRSGAEARRLQLA